MDGIIESTERCLLVCITLPTNGDIPVVVVGERVDGVMQIVNAFQGDEAKEIFDRLVTKKEGTTDGTHQVI